MVFSVLRSHAETDACDASTEPDLDADLICVLLEFPSALFERRRPYVAMASIIGSAAFELLSM